MIQYSNFATENPYFHHEVNFIDFEVVFRVWSSTKVLNAVLTCVNCDLANGPKINGLNSKTIFEYLKLIAAILRDQLLFHLNHTTCSWSRHVIHFTRGTEQRWSDKKSRCLDHIFFFIPCQHHAISMAYNKIEARNEIRWPKIWGSTCIWITRGQPHKLCCVGAPPTDWIPIKVQEKKDGFSRADLAFDFPCLLFLLTKTLACQFWSRGLFSRL